MLSVLLYGRNDSHGYNLHKRGAISLNCIAEVLTEDDDEIIFVDYNSPDQIPTFPEAIADTISDKAKRHLRIIRVRPGYHRQFTDKTHLVALESQSRNIALRRANPANQWILSTNTDMIFVPRSKGKSLSESVGSLDEGFYHLPRFELPEALWELFDRRDPAGTIDRVDEWGTAYHLNEVVYGGYDNVYEAPGDFQLFVRNDLEKIGGFDESMILGWHVDSNIARRMKLLRGEVKSAVDHVFGYHCGHTRQPTMLHGSGFSSNSLDTYVREVTDPYLPQQLRTWGAPDVQFEERRLPTGKTSVMVKALSTAIGKAGPDLSEVTLNQESYDLTTYDASHVLPHLINLVGEAPPRSTFLMIGTDAELFEQTGKALGSLGLEPQMLWADGPKDCKFAKSVKLADGLKRADTILLQFPGRDPDLGDDWRTARWQAQRALEQIIASERELPKEDRHLVVLINAAHTPLQDTFLPAMTYTAIPYTARLRHGYVSLPPTQGTTAQPAAASGRLRPFTPDDHAFVNHIAKDRDAPKGWERLALELPDIVEEGDFDAADPAIARVLETARQHVQKSALRCPTPPVAADGRDVIVSRLASATDWENPFWLATAERCFGPAIYTHGARSRWSWERASMVHSLLHHVSPDERPWILIVTPGPDCLPTLASFWGYRVAYTTYRAFTTGQPLDTAGWDEALRVWHIIPHADVISLDDARKRGVEKFGAVLIAGTEISSHEDAFKKVGTKLQEFATPDAFVGFTVQVHLNAGRGGALALDEWQRLTNPNGLLRSIGLGLADELDARVPLDCVVRFAAEDATTYAPGLSFGWGDSIVTIGLINSWRGAGKALRRQAPTIRTAAPVDPVARTASPAFEPTPGKAAAIHARALAPAAGTPPEAVLTAGMAAAGSGFACQLFKGIKRDLSGFIERVEGDTGGATWWILPVRTDPGTPLSVTLSGSSSAPALIQADGSSTSFSPGADPDSWELSGVSGSQWGVAIKGDTGDKPTVRMG